MFRCALFVLLSGVTLSGSARSADDRPQWANPEHWEFLGALTFEVPKLREALAADMDVLLASRTSLETERFAKVLTERLAAGYRYSGFPDVEVTHEIVVERQRIALTVKEGPRYHRGDIRIEGAKTLPVDELITGLSHGTGPADAFQRWTKPPAQGGVREWVKANGEVVQKEAAAWKRGEPMAFHPDLERQIATKCKEILQRHGYLEPTLSTAVERQTDGTTTLVVSIEDEGPRSVLGTIEIHGPRINTPESLEEFLGVKTGDLVDIDTASRLEWQLKESARFYDAKVELTPPPFGDGPCRLDVTVFEIPGLPAIDEPFTELQEAAVRAA
ncbi:MAG: hypothetical protein Q8K78_00250, partial [Planctomycetaceae bacterium]|nr:hypothetical protein [Planctomycetaceae bacterium]